jgi:V/A-type H+/Na+-transporting ATPase subunit G/H
VVNALTLELVKSIKEAEAKGEAIIREAQQDSRRIQKEAVEKAALIMADAEAEAKSKARELVKQAEEEARAEAEPLVMKQQQEIARMQEVAAGRMQDAVALLKDKVVKINADN